MYIPELQILGVIIPTWFLFGWLNVLAAKALLIVLIHRRGLALSTTLALVMLYTLGGALGALVMTSIMGVLAVAISLFMVGKRLLGVQQPLGDLLALSIALIVGVGRMGCLLSGCCFGTPTNLPWGVSYAAGTLPSLLHRAAGFIDASAITSLAVHPVPAYETLFLLPAALLLGLFGRRLRNPDAALPLFFAAYLVFRLLLEFIRDLNNVWWSVIPWGPLTAFQWVLLLLAVGFGVWAATTWRRAPESIEISRISLAEKSGLGAVALVAPAAALYLALSPQFFAIHSVQLALLIPLVLLVRGVELLRVDSRRWFPAMGYGIVGLVLLVGPGMGQLTAQLKSALEGRDSVLKRKMAIYAYDAQSRKLVRLGDETISLKTFRRASRYLALQPDGSDPDSAYQAFTASLGQPYVRDYVGGEGGRYKIETCAGVDTYVYGGAVGGREWVTPTRTGSLRRGIRGAIEVTGGDDQFTNLSVMAYGAADYRWLALGASAALFPLGAYGEPYDPPGMVGGYLRLGPERVNISAGFMDHSMVRTSPLYGHLALGLKSSTGLRSQWGMTTLGRIPAFFVTFDVRTTTGRLIRPSFFVFPPSSGDETSGIGLKITFYRSRLRALAARR